MIEVICKGEDHRKKVIAALSSIYRAMSAYHRRRDLPNIEFIFTIEDMAQNPKDSIWALTRRAHDQDIWLMPDFGFWSWNVEGIGPFGQVVSDIAEKDVDSHWEKKQKKLIWRGKLSFAPRLRRALVQMAKHKSWSAVRALRWGNEESMRKDFISSIDQCDYMFIAHTEGASCFLIPIRLCLPKVQVVVTRRLSNTDKLADPLSLFISCSGFSIIIICWYLMVPSRIMSRSNVTLLILTKR